MTPDQLPQNLAITSFFEREMPRCLPYIRAHAQKYLKNEETINDILQMGWLKLYERLTERSLHGLRPGPMDAHYAWLKTVIKNDALDYLKEQKRFKLLDPAEALALLEVRGGNEPSPEMALTYRETQEDLVSLLQAIPRNQRVVLYQHLYHGISFEEIATQSVRSPNTVRSWYSRGRKHLKQIVTRKIAPADLLLLLYHSVIREER